MLYTSVYKCAYCIFTYCSYLTVLHPENNTVIFSVLGADLCCMSHLLSLSPLHFLYYQISIEGKMPKINKSKTEVYFKLKRTTLLKVGSDD